MTIRLEPGDCLEVMAALAGEGVRLDAVVCDPPYHLTSIVKRFGKKGSAPVRSNGATGVYKRSAAGFMGKAWDGGEVAFRPETWRLAFDLLKPGGHLLAFGGTRTYHRMACAVEDAGFEVRDMVQWLYGSGFPKSKDVAKGIDSRRDWSKVERLNREIERARRDAGLSLREIGCRMLAATDGRYGSWYHRGGHMFFETGKSLPSRPEWEELRKVLPIADEFVEVYAAAEREKTGQHDGDMGGLGGERLGSAGGDVTIPKTDAAKRWDGWGTALKPACEPIILARKPLAEGSVAANLLKHGAGALNVAGCRVEAPEGKPARGGHDNDASMFGMGSGYAQGTTDEGRWPANVAHDGSPEVLAVFPEAPGALRAAGGEDRSNANVFPTATRPKRDQPPRGDSGSAARFFYSAKADAEDRWGSKHPTVKPVGLMRWLVRLVTPPGGLLCDPFAGSGTTGVACLAEGRRAILIENDAEYLADISERLAFYAGEGKHSLASKGRKVEADKAGGQDLPLFGGEG